MTTAARVNVTEIIDQSPLRWFHWRIFALCVLCLMVDGFSLQIITFAAPSLIREWKIPAAAMGPVFSASLVGVLFGSFLFSTLADRIGRRPVLIGVTIFYAVFTYLTASAASVHELIGIRFLAGIGLGGIMPNAMALAGEYAPAKKRVAIMMIVSSGFSAGAVVGGLVSQWVIPHHGWRALFLAGAGSALAVAALMAAFLPESIPFLLLKGKRPAAIERSMRRLRPGSPAGEGTAWFVEERGTTGGPLVPLFREGRTIGTLLIWALNFMNLLNLYFLTSWLPTAVREFGFSNAIALRAGTTVQIGGLLGGIILGLVVQRLGFIRVLTTVFVMGCLSIATIGLPAAPLALLFVAIFLAGLCIPGGQTGVNALAATYYPTDLRSTGIGAGLGVGRLGAILGPWIAGELLLHHWPSRDLFLVATIPALISALSVVAIRGRLRADAMRPLAPQT